MATVKLLGLILIGFILGVVVGGVLFDSGPGVDLVPLLFGVAGAAAGLMVGIPVLRRRSD